MTTDRKAFIENAGSFAALAAFIGIPSVASADAKPCAGGGGRAVRRDLHASTLGGLGYLIENYGEESARRVLRNVATTGFRPLREKLAKGDSSELIGWWRHYLDREGAKYSLETQADGSAVLTVRECPALRYFAARGISGGGRICWATNVLNGVFCEGSPFEVVLERTDGASACRQVLRRKRGQL